jgi:hypothetical protein
MTCQVTLGGRQPRYRCKDHNHLTRNVAHTDRVVLAHIFYALTHPRRFELLAPPPPDVVAVALRDERSAIRARLEQFAVDEVLGNRNHAQVTAATRAGNARIEEIDNLLNATATSDPLAEFVNAPDPVKKWRDAPLANQRLVLERICTVTLLPSGRRGRGFDPATVRVDAKHSLGAPDTIPAAG